MSFLTAFDILVLSDMVGEKVPDMTWGAAMSDTIEKLVRTGHAVRQITDDNAITYVITDEGRAAVKQAAAEARS
jgi:hypothetical protein